MEALLYITKRSFINKAKAAVKKPVTFLLLAAGIAYAVMILASFGSLFRTLKFDSIYGLLVILTLWTVYIFFANFMSYAGKKGVIFHPSDTHFVFTAPISPKTVLLFRAWKNYVMSLVVNLLFVLGGATIFHVPPIRLVLLFFVGTVCEIALEGSIMVFLYTNEKLPRKLIDGICKGIKVFLIGMTLALIWYFRTYHISLESARALIDHPVLQMMPVVGWNVAVYRLILLGPTALNLMCTGLYAVVVAVMVLAAARMKCEGEYYEDAAKFADDYVDMKRRNKNGETVMSIGKRKKFKSVSGNFKATGAKAIFYRQLLEYKKERFFIFGWMSVVCFGVAVIFPRMMNLPKIAGSSNFYLLGIIAYIVLITTGYAGKWEKELKNPYLYLIPDSYVKKMWYATAMEHIKALVDGCLICIPMGIYWKMKPSYIVMGILIYTVLQANRLYSKVVVETMIGDILGKTGKSYVVAFLQMFILGIGIGIAAMVGILIRLDLVFPIILIYSMIVTVVIALLASIRFGMMEQMA